ncbi:hypothetical protein BO71DRAFT_392147 [Aspergillus ellipticus CBS 707.79]|uniref:Zn(2)-C6 fungal-type domain-containing protein n=1 Tax=Aspergillus ellipticus CBS 707.79 TaxID=1448320 RepID=A0A319EAM6_9EURO|nr:hypothetical protein BO71DRAFT_392147 [Aspergillus ellipticus CBS 707.79]
MAGRSCGTCRDRRILCDRTLPICTQCSQSNRTCKGYGIRLSWPKASNTRRAVVGRLPSHSKSAVRRFSDARQVNISTWDLELHNYLLGLGPYMSTQLVLRSPMPFNPRQVEVADDYLLQYFQTTASQCLTTFGHDPTDIGNLLMRIALVNDSSSAAAVLRSILALSSLHRDGLHPQAADHKISALRALVTASNSSISTMEAAQHVAAGMLLLSFEIYQASCTSGQWTRYLIGVKSIIRASSLSHPEHRGEFSTLLDWVHYHDVLLRFSMLHWHREGSQAKSALSDACTEPSALTSSPYNTALSLLSDVCDAVSAKLSHNQSVADLHNYKSFLKTIGFRIRNIASPGTPSKDGPGTTMAVELFQSAMLVYLNRASGNLLELASETEQRIEKVFAILSKLASCERQFPLFILGCQARTDGERCTVLDLIARTEKMASSRSLFLVKSMIQAIWVQDDLANGAINYVDKLSAVMSCCAIMPTFV